MGGMGVSVSRREVSVMMEENSREVGVGMRLESVITSIIFFFGWGKSVQRACRRWLVVGEAVPKGSASFYRIIHISVFKEHSLQFFFQLSNLVFVGSFVQLDPRSFGLEVGHRLGELHRQHVVSRMVVSELMSEFILLYHISVIREC